MLKACFDMPKVRVEDQMCKLTCQEHNFYIYEWISKKNFAHLFSILSTSVMGKAVLIDMSKVGQMFKLTLS